MFSCNPTEISPDTHLNSRFDPTNEKKYFDRLLEGEGDGEGEGD
jgi:hypothetical protein